MAKGIPGYPNMGTDLQGNPVPPIYKNGKVVPPPTTPPTTTGNGAGAVSVLTKGKAGTTIPAAETPVDVQALRSMLVKAGYNIPATGNTPGNLFKAALKDFLQPNADHPISAKLMQLLGIDKGNFATGLRDPKSFNQRFGLLKGGKVAPPTKNPSSRLTSDGSPTAADTTSMGFGPQAPPPAIDLSGLDGLSLIGAKIGHSLDPALADKLAGLEFDPQIHDQGILAGRQGRDAKQALHDIGQWYGQAEGAQGVAATRDHAISQAGVGSVKDAVSHIIASLGGSANEGSGLVGAAGADSIGTLAALGANQDQYNTDLAPLLKAEAAGQSSRQTARNAADAQSIAQKIVDLQGQRGQKKADYGMQITKENNALDQQRFQNQMALENARVAAALTGAKIIDANTKAAAAGDKPVKGSFRASSTTDRAHFAGALQSALVGADGKPHPGMTRSKAMAIAQRLAHLYFPQGGIPNGSGVISGILANAGF